MQYRVPSFDHLKNRQSEIQTDQKLPPDRFLEIAITQIPNLRANIESLETSKISPDTCRAYDARFRSLKLKIRKISIMLHPSSIDAWKNVAKDLEISSENFTTDKKLIEVLVKKKRQLNSEIENLEKLFKEKASHAFIDDEKKYAQDELENKLRNNIQGMRRALDMLINKGINSITTGHPGITFSSNQRAAAKILSNNPDDFLQLKKEYEDLVEIYENQKQTPTQGNVRNTILAVKLQDLEYIIEQVQKKVREGIYINAKDRLAEDKKNVLDLAIKLWSDTIENNSTQKYGNLRDICNILSSTSDVQAKFYGAIEKYFSAYTVYIPSLSVQENESLYEIILENLYKIQQAYTLKHKNASDFVAQVTDLYNQKHEIVLYRATHSGYTKK
jgi:hypothetical protein